MKKLHFAKVSNLLKENSLLIIDFISNLSDLQTKILPLVFHFTKY